MPVSLDGFIETASGDINWSFPELHHHFNDRESTIGTYVWKTAVREYGGLLAHGR
jgi:dihydrofolate reductase